MGDKIKLGIDETLELLDFMITFGNGLGAAYEDKKIDMTDWAYFIPVMSKIAPAFKGISQIPKEAMDYDEDELSVIETFVKEKFDIVQDNIEELVEDTINQALSLYGYLSKHFFNKASE